MKTEMKILVALLSVFSIGFVGLSMAEEIDASDSDAGIYYYDENAKEYVLFTDKGVQEFNGGDVLTVDGNLVFHYDLEAVTIVGTDMTSPSNFALNNVNADIGEHSATFPAEKYTASSIDLATISEEEMEKYSRVYFEMEDGNIIATYWMFKVKITFSAAGEKSYFVYNRDVLSKLQIDASPVEFDNKAHSVMDALNNYEVTIVSGDDDVTNVDKYNTEISVTIGNTPITVSVDWYIVPRSIEKVDTIKVSPVSQETIKNKSVKDVKIVRMYDSEVKYSLKKNIDYRIDSVNWNTLELKLVGLSKLDNSAYGNYTDYVIVPLEVAPTEFSGTAHVDIIQTDGYLSASMFTNDNTFIYPYIELTYAYEQDESGNMVLKSNDVSFPVVYRSNCQIVVRDASGQIVIDEVAGITEGMTSSEWNYIELYGVNGFIGCAAGSFYVSISGTPGLLYNAAGNKVIGYDGSSADVIIPAMHNGVKVTKIADKAFYNNKTIESVVIGDNVVQVGMKAFANCSNLKSVVFGDSVKIIYSYAFFGCKNLEMLDFGLNLTNVKLKAFGSVTLQDASGNEIEAVSKNLKGNTFEGSKGVLKLVA